MPCAWRTPSRTASATAWAASSATRSTLVSTSPVASANRASPSRLVWAGDTARAMPVCARSATRHTPGLRSRALVTTQPMTVLEMPPASSRVPSSPRRAHNRHRGMGVAGVVGRGATAGDDAAVLAQNTAERIYGHQRTHRHAARATYRGALAALARPFEPGLLADGAAGADPHGAVGGLAGGRCFASRPARLAIDAAHVRPANVEHHRRSNDGEPTHREVESDAVGFAPVDHAVGRAQAKQARPAQHHGMAGLVRSRRPEDRRLACARRSAAYRDAARGSGGGQDHGASGVVLGIGPHPDPHAFDPERHRYPVSGSGNTASSSKRV